MIETRMSVRRATATDATIAAQILSEGFAADPILAWVLTDPVMYPMWRDAQ